MKLPIDAWKMNWGASNRLRLDGNSLGCAYRPLLCPATSCGTVLRPSKWGEHRPSTSSKHMRRRCSTGTGPYPLNSPWSSGYNFRTSGAFHPDSLTRTNYCASTRETGVGVGDSAVPSPSLLSIMKSGPRRLDRRNTIYPSKLIVPQQNPGNLSVIKRSTS